MAKKKSAAKKAVVTRAVPTAKKVAAPKTATKKVSVKTVKKKSPAAKPASAKKATAPTKNAAIKGAGAPPSVRVQMFRHGLGDSFLVTFDDQGPNERRMFIDCGSLGNKVSKINTASIAKYLQSLIAKGKKIDVLIATHEHQDHLSGFHSDLQPVLKDHVDHVWLAWTENPDDEDARRITKYKGDLAESLQKVAELAPDSQVGKNITSMLGFAGDTNLGAAFAKTVNDSMEFVRTGTGGKTVYHSPGDLIDDDVIPGFRIYVLGPPRSEVALKDVGSHESDELYKVAALLSRTADLHLKGVTDAGCDPDTPFDERYQQYGAKTKEAQYPRYVDPENDWRQIEFDWLNGSSELALQLDNLTNNTSLALAIERVADGKVLLFPADAQEGNWLSWHDEKMKWEVIDASGVSQNVTAADLLSRTVFYKVGHHGSHNATAKGKGLELMTQAEDLVAFIPVDRAMALTRSPKDSWQMPARPLFTELLKRCQGRVARADLGWAAPAVKGQNGSTVEDELAGIEDAATWAEWQKNQKAAKHVNVSDPLFIEYVLN